MARWQPSHNNATKGVDMGSSLSLGDQELLGRLLSHVAEKDRGFLPDPAYRPFHKLVPWPAVEVLIHDEDGRFVLSYREDDFVGWHIPGGFIRAGESYQNACDRNVRKERIVQAVTDLRLISSHVWLVGEHPFGYPISLTIACRAVGMVAVREDLRWFSEIPPEVIKEQHPNYLRHFREWVMDPRRPSAAIL